ncbi:MAG: FISUMP domain-containing protein, partial [Chitinophagaceae bacterium]
RGLAPQGWHIPSDEEWTTLTTTLGGTSVAGGKMKEAGIVNWTSPNTAADNSSGWAGMPGGYRNYDGTFSGIGSGGNWWSSSEYYTAAWFRYLSYGSGDVYRNPDPKKTGFSVRCLRD